MIDHVRMLWFNCMKKEEFPPASSTSIPPSTGQNNLGQEYLSKEVSVVFLQCHHVATCINIDNCYICHGPIGMYVNTFLV